jgi:predicted NAD/FAD-dependent oxidoreductase
MSQPRVAVVGGGIAGTLCSLVLKNRGFHPVLIDQGSRGLGGRLRGGAQFIRAADPRLAQVTNMLAQQGLLQEWKGRFGVLGSAGGGFLSSEIVTENNPSKENSTTRATAIDGGDFCNFVEGSQSPTYVGVPSMADLCPEICRLADIESVGNTKVVGATPIPEGGWKLDADGDGLGDEVFDAMVVATHDPSLAGGIVRRIAEGEVLAAGGASIDHNEDDQSSTLILRLTELSEKLQSVRDQGRRPVCTLSLTYPPGFSAKIPFDAVSVPGSHYVQFLARQASKPEYTADSDAGDVWWAVSTSSLAADLLSRPNLSYEEKLSSISELASEEISRLLLPYHEDETGVLLPLDVSTKRWGAAFCVEGLNLKEDSVILAPWRLAICGDFVRDLSVHATPLEAAALSGLEAGERTASLFS